MPRKKKSSNSSEPSDAKPQIDKAEDIGSPKGGVVTEQNKALLNAPTTDFKSRMNGMYRQEVESLVSRYNESLEKMETKHLPALVDGNLPEREGLGALQALDNVTIVCAPDLAMAYSKNWLAEPTEKPEEAQMNSFKAQQMKMFEHCTAMKYRFAILDAPRSNMSVQAIRDWRLNTAAYDTSYAALYYPWIQVDDPLHPGKKKAIPPSGHIAGVYARTDAEQGVHKAPANEQINGVIDLPINVTSNEQETLNPEGINCIRKFPGRGIRIWGARTLSNSDKSWKYINVRRLFSYVGASIDRDTQWTVFEANNEKLWAKVRRNITSFLRNVWRSGALYGSSPEEAFYVRCDETLNDNYTRSIGQMICEIGLRPNFPAEFVIFRISQWAGPGSDEG